MPDRGGNKNNGGKRVVMGFIPKLYPDELLYSLIARYSIIYPGYIYAAEDIYQHRTVRPDVEFVNAYTDDALKWITKDMSWGDIIQSHTMFPAYARFMPLIRRKEAYNALLIREGNWRNLVAHVQAGPRYIRFCPLCVAEDREKYGEAYIHRVHQIPRVDVCAQHSCYLENSVIQISGKTSPGLHAAETIFTDIIPRMCDNKIELMLAGYITSTMDYVVDLTNDMPAGVFLNSRISSEYKNKTGMVRRISDLYRAYTDFFGTSIQLMSFDQMQKVYNGSKWDLYYVCQLALFEGITPQELCCLPKKISVPGIEDLYTSLSKKYSVDKSIVEEIGNSVLQYSRQRMTVQKRSGHMARAWDKVDEETLPRVKKVIADILSSPGRPKKITISSVQTAVGLRQKQIYNLLNCLEYIKSHAETQPEFWAREVVWAVKEMQQNEREFNWRHIRDLTNMKPRDLKKCWQFIKDDKIRKLIEQILLELKI